MIKYNLKCDQGHCFDSWFDGADAFEKLERAGILSCSVCGSNQIERGLMAPRVSPARTKEAGPLSAPASPAEQAMAELRKKIEAETEDVGRDFVRQARAIHDGELPNKAIRGESRLADAKALIEDGVPVFPLPWGQKKTN